MTLDIDNYVTASKTDINIDSGLYKGNLGLGGEHAITELYADFILVEYIDINEGGMKEEGGLYIPQTDHNNWRLGRVLMVGNLVSDTHPGDIVCFPNDKGLVTSKTNYVENGVVKSTNNAIFLNERRLFAKLTKI